MKNTKLELNEVPNFNQKTKRAKGDATLDLCYELMMAPNGRRYKSAAQLRQIWGNKSNSPTAQFLSACTRQVGIYSQTQSFAHTTVPHRVKKLEVLLGRTDGLLHYAESIGKSFRVAPPLDHYKHVKDRNYNWWTNVPSAMRQELFVMTHGVMYDIDIEAAKPDLTLQAWRKWMAEFHPVALKQNPECKLSTWSRLVADRKKFRAEMALACGISKEDAKWVCQLVLNGSWISEHKNNGIAKMVGTKAARRIMDNELYRGLQKDFRVMWRYFEKNKKPGQTRGQFMSEFYTKLELQVMTVVAGALSEEGVPAWFIHDGVFSNREINLQGLVEEVKFYTGYDVKFEMKVFSRVEGEVQEKTPSQPSVFSPPQGQTTGSSNDVHFVHEEENPQVIILGGSRKTSSDVHSLLESRRKARRRGNRVLKSTLRKAA